MEKRNKIVLIMNNKRLYQFKSGDALETVVVIASDPNDALVLVRQSQREQDFDDPHPFTLKDLNFSIKITDLNSEAVLDYQYLRDCAMI
jgi:hypothetical protein